MKNDVRTIREQLGMTQGQLASELGVDLSTVWRWENGTPIRKAHMKLLEMMAEASDSTPPDEKRAEAG